MPIIDFEKLERQYRAKYTNEAAPGPFNAKWATFLAGNMTSIKAWQKHLAQQDRLRKKKRSPPKKAPKTSYPTPTPSMTPVPDLDRVLLSIEQSPRLHERNLLSPAFSVRTIHEDIESGTSSGYIGGCPQKSQGLMLPPWNNNSYSLDKLSSMSGWTESHDTDNSMSQTSSNEFQQPPNTLTSPEDTTSSFLADLPELPNIDEPASQWKGGIYDRLLGHFDGAIQNLGLTEEWVDFVLGSCYDNLNGPDNTPTHKELSATGLLFTEVGNPTDLANSFVLRSLIRIGRFIQVVEKSDDVIKRAGEKYKVLRHHAYKVHKERPSAGKKQRREVYALAKAAIAFSGDLSLLPKEFDEFGNWRPKFGPNRAV